MKKWVKQQSAKNLEAPSELLKLRHELECVKTENASLKVALHQDDLTGLLNARALRERMSECISNFQHEGAVPALLFIDVDHFKEVNELHGHQSAGRVLEQVGRIIGRVVRTNDLAFRYGGDEFVVLVAGGLFGAKLVGERIRRTIESTLFQVSGLSGKQTVRLTVSVGARVIKEGEKAETVLQEADRAMFEAKRNSRNTFVAAS